MEEKSILNKTTIDKKLYELGINSIKLIKIIVLIELEFGIVFDDEYLDINKLTNIRDLTSYVERKINR